MGKIFLEEDAAALAACLLLAPVCGPGFRVSWSFSPHKTLVELPVDFILGHVIFQYLIP